MTYLIIKPDTIQSTMMGNVEMTKQFLERYLVQTPGDFENLTVAVSDKNRLNIARYAHHIKPTMEYIGASEMRINFQQLETLARSNAPIEELENTFTMIESQFNLLMTELASYLASLK
ncbi:Hpt domain-containing protein [Sphingobacterium lumbrici]|uniref:Hpt domain-containing protein n=1 Tax=Sphingobacterium lumbrici TaxID=2559600 RepID=UPI00112EA8D7|nr:hypothetical protein [Sphingobacterium lumbrici]